jgi:hypothetical protein
VQAIPIGADSAPSPCLPKPARALAEIEEFYKLLYRRPTPDDGGVQLGMVLRQAFEHCGGLVQLGAGDEVEGDVDPSGRLVITIGEELDPLSASTGMFEQLVSFSLNPTLQEQIIEDGYGGDLFANGRLGAVRAQTQELGAVVLELYKAAVSIASEPADWVIAIDAISQGEWSAAIGFLPFVPAGAKYVIKKKGTQQVLAEFSSHTVSVLEGAMRAMKLDKIRGRLNVVRGLRDMRNAGFADQKLIDAMVDSGHLTITNSSGYKQLKRVLGPPPSFLGIGYEAHHWIPLERPIQDKALRQCIDPNEHGIWLKKAIHQQIHNVPVPGFFYRGKEFSPNKYNDIWKEFFSGNYFENATDQEILDFVRFLQSSVYKL